MNRKELKVRIDIEHERVILMLRSTAVFDLTVEEALELCKEIELLTNKLTRGKEEPGA